jgi:hypothetical protein
VTDETIRDLAARQQELGTVKFITKPVDFDQLKVQLRQLSAALAGPFYWQNLLSRIKADLLSRDCENRDRDHRPFSRLH